jgi:hypothetical protein
MLGKALAALAAAGGTAVVQAVGTDIWTEVRRAVAGWLGRGDEHRERVELERLDLTAGALQAAGSAEVERVRIRQEAAWQARFEALLESLDDVERARAAEALRDLLPQPTPGLAVGGNAEIRADNGSIAAGVIGGGARILPPSPPDPSQG